MSWMHYCPLPAGCEPVFSRMIGSHRANDYSLSLTQARRDIPKGVFGFVGSYWCHDCKGFDREPKSVCTSRPTYWEPGEYEWECPKCGSRNVGENEQAHGMKVLHRCRMNHRRAS